MLSFEGGGKPENLEKNPRSNGENQQQTLVGVERYHHCAIPGINLKQYLRLVKRILGCVARNIRWNQVNKRFYFSNLQICSDRHKVLFGWYNVPYLLSRYMLACKQHWKEGRSRTIVRPLYRQFVGDRCHIYPYRLNHNAYLLAFPDPISVQQGSFACKYYILASLRFFKICFNLLIVEPTDAGPMLEEMVTSSNSLSEQAAGVLEPSLMKSVSLE